MPAGEQGNHCLYVILSLYTCFRHMWRGDTLFLLTNLILKDFRVRYRNASLGILWSLLNPLVMMLIFWFVFTKIFANQIANYPIFLLCGLVPFNFFSLAWSTGTLSLVDNGGIVKRTAVPRDLIPISTVFAGCIHLGIQLVLLLVLVLASGIPVNRYWALLPIIWVLEIAFVCGLSLMTSVVNIYVRDTRYIVESVCLVMMWLVPIFYPFSFVNPEYRDIYQYNPVAAIVLASRNILLEAKAPPPTLLWKLLLAAAVSLGCGYTAFRMLRRRIADYL